MDDAEPERGMTTTGPTEAAGLLRSARAVLATLVVAALGALPGR